MKTPTVSKVHVNVCFKNNKECHCAFCPLQTQQQQSQLQQISHLVCEQIYINNITLLPSSYQGT